MMRYCAIVLLLGVFVLGLPCAGYANPTPAPPIITEFSTDEDWIEIAFYDYNFNLYVNGEQITVYTDEIDYSQRPIVLDQTNTSGFDLTDGYGSIEFSGSYNFGTSELKYGTWGKFPAPPKNESVIIITSAMSMYSEFSIIFPYPTPGKPNIKKEFTEYTQGSSDIIINEILPYDSNSNISFIELYNRGNTPVDIGGWSVICGARLTIPDGEIINPGEILAINKYFYPDEFMRDNFASEGILYLQNDEYVMLESVGWTDKPHDNHSLVRYPDGFATSYMSYNTASAIDFRESIPTPGMPNQVLYPIVSITAEEDTTAINPGDTHQFYVRALDENDYTFRIKPDAWHFDSDFASIDELGIITGFSYGVGTIQTEYEGFSDSINVFGTISGNIENNMTLFAEEGPYYIGKVSVHDDVTLTITPGTTLIHIGMGTYIRFYGENISLKGTPDNPIRFVSYQDGNPYRTGVHVSGRSECVFEYCVFDNFGTAIYLDPGSRKKIISNCVFINNESSIHSDSNTNTVISNCLFSGDAVTDTGIQTEKGNLDSVISSDVVRNNVFLNLKQALFIENGATTDVNNNIVYNCSTGISIDEWNDDLHINHNNIWNTDTPYSGDTGSLGIITTQNANGTLSDAYFNISADPLFADPENGDFRLLAGSPCIDAGDPNILDGDGTVSDIGYLSGTSPVGVQTTAATPAVLQLSQNSPNPFNAATVIPFTLPDAGHVTLEVYSITGQKVATLIDDHLSAGSHHANFDGSQYSSGIYFTRLIAGGTVQTGKMLLVK